MRASSGLPSFRTEVVRNLFRQVLWKQRTRAYAGEFQVVHFSIQKDHVHLIVEAAAKERTKSADRGALRRGEVAAKGVDREALRRGEAAAKERTKSADREEFRHDEATTAERKYADRDALRRPEAAAKEPRKEPRKHADREALRRGVSGLAISFARRLNRVLRRKGKVWGDRHHRRDLESPTEVRNTLLYVLQNHRRHGVKARFPGMLDPYSTAVRFRHWADAPITIIETEPWPAPTPRTWLLSTGWLRGGGPLRVSELPSAVRARE